MNRHTLRLTVTALLCLLPLTAQAQTSLTIGELTAGLGGDAHVEGAAANASLHLVIQTNTDGTLTIPLTTDAKGAATAALPGASLTEAGNYTATLLQKDMTALAETHFSIFPDRVDGSKSLITADKQSISPDGSDAAHVTVTLRDRYGNPLSGRPVKLVSSLAQATVTPVDNETNTAGRQQFNVQSTQAGQITLRAFDLLSDQTLDATLSIGAGTLPMGGGYPSGMPYPPYPYPPYPYGYPPYPGNPYSADLLNQAYAQNPTFDVIDHFEITLSPASMKTNDVGDLTIRAVDRRSQTVENYNGTVTITSTDPNATLPGLGPDGKTGTVTFTAKNMGEKFLPLSVSFSQGGNQTIRVEDRTDPSHVISGQVSVNVSGETVIDDAHRIEVFTPEKDGGVNKTSFDVTGIGPRYANLTVKIMGGMEDSYTGETDKDGHFSIPVVLKTDRQQYTLRIQDESGRYDSGDIDFTIKTTPPPIISVVFSPEKPEENSGATLTVQTDPKSQVQMTLLTQQYGLLEDGNRPGFYKLIFTAPQAGNYQPTIDVKDSAGNVSQARVILNVVPKGLSTVQNVTAVGRANAVELHWDPIVNETVSNYRIYLGTDPKSFLTIDTKDSTPGAVVAGLKAGSTYYFAVTALQGSRESKEKSTIISGQPIGIEFRVLPSDSALGLSWAIPGSTPLSSFILEYGTDPDTYIEKRVLNGGLRTFILRDLLNDVTYYLRLTPVTTTGEILTDLAATTQGMPKGTGSGFHPSAGETIGTAPNVLPPPNDLHEGAPSTPSSGLPGMAMMLTAFVAFAGCALYWFQKRNRRMAAFQRLVDAQYRRSV